MSEEENFKLIYSNYNKKQEELNSMKLRNNELEMQIRVIIYKTRNISINSKKLMKNTKEKYLNINLL